MSIRFFITHSILALSVLGATAARAQTVTPNPPAAVTVAVRVGGGERDQALHDDAKRRALEIAKLIAAKLP